MNDPLPLPGHVWTLSTAVGYSFWTPERNFVFQSSTHSILILTPREKNPKPNQKQNKSPPRIKKKTKKQLRKGFEERKPLKFQFNLNTGELKPHIGLFIG